MAEKLNDKEIVSFEGLQKANIIKTDALFQLLIGNGFMIKYEFFNKFLEDRAK